VEFNCISVVKCVAEPPSSQETSTEIWMLDFTFSRWEIGPGVLPKSNPSLGGPCWRQRVERHQRSGFLWLAVSNRRIESSGVAAMDTIELKFLLKLLALPTTAPLSKIQPNKQTKASDRERVCRKYCVAVGWNVLWNNKTTLQEKAHLS